MSRIQGYRRQSAAPSSPACGRVREGHARMPRHGWGVALSPPEAVPASEIEVLQKAEKAMPPLVRLIPAMPVPNHSQISGCDCFLRIAKRVE